MRSRQLLLPLGLLFIALCVPSNAQNAEETTVEVAEGAPLTVECALRVEQRAEWRRDGGPLPAGLRARPDAPAAPAGPPRAVARLHTAAAARAHAGVYTCALPPAARVRVVVRAAAAGADDAATDAAPAGAGEGAGPVLYFDVGKGFSFNCTLPGAGLPYEWRVNGTALPAAPAAPVKGVTTLVAPAKGVTALETEEYGAVLRSAGRTHELDFGNYSCARGGAELVWELRGRPHTKLPPNPNVVEGQKLKISCKVLARPYPAQVWWRFSNETGIGGGAVNGTDVQLVFGERVQLQPNDQGVDGATLVLEAAQAGDAGEYSCGAAEGVPASTTVRVKDMYAALWPFLGICAEVLLLCTVILVYEKRRTKPELDDSDTDNHDQKKS